MTTLTNAVVLVTGANGGLGVHFVEQALARGAAKVYATARTPRTWDDARVVPLRLDVTDPASIAYVLAQTGDTTVLINNAGIEKFGTLLATSPEDVRAIYETNVFGPIALVQAYAPVLAGHGGGAIINVHSALSFFSIPGVYSSTKSAFWGATNSLRVELASQGTQVLGAHLGYTDTPMIQALDVPKGDPRDVVNNIYTDLEAGAHESLADEIARGAHASLSAPIHERYAAQGITAA
ncbi:NAD(P)-dependent dehydrogenase (short-subunit alcohol dehydrogenase family) [Mycetocola sp. BIGb0189]|uniref:SDR family oxidoreductase n=1 Tax=Mycetocola sp. BIGb0189 TaxID=2940604 RepID=UPI002169AD44|nr:SDR family oxidoreductase [Mycetocola sp. BIGb0189]MCS4276882.1 NAD(P)-dependent dehydrogenase (short-subunit alcohol dehydrogenase family) [Mycetocola sp. BIGb0189]